jgi:long-chain fatty acid transport protein
MNSWVKKITACFLLLIFQYVMLAASAHAAGFGIFTQDAAALGKANAQVAHTDNPSAIFFNPALLNQLEGTQIRLGTTLMFPDRKFNSDLDGRRYKTKSDVFYPSTFYLSHKANERFALGIGVFNPFGLGTDWGETWEGRYLATNSEMETYNINPSFSYQATPWLSVGGGVSLLFLDTTLERKVFLFDPAIGQLPDGNQRFKGDGEGFGYNLGVLIDLPGDFSIGASYRSRIKVDIDGDMKFKLPDPSLAFLLPNTPASVDLELPAVVHAAVSYTGFDRWTIETGLRWEEWSSYDKLDLKLKEPIFDGQQFTDKISEEKKWKDTFAFNLGVEYQLNDMVSLRTGYLYGNNPVPDKTFEPSIPDSDVHLFTLGTGLKYNNFKFDLAYGYQKMESRKKNNELGSLYGQPANGKYESEIHLIGMSIGYSF